MERAVIHIDIKKTLFSPQGPITLEVKTDIPRGILTALFGPSGAGKTTILRMLAGLTVPDEGSIRIGDTVWFDSTQRINIPPQQRHIGMMFQDYALFPNMTVRENIQFAQDTRDPSFTNELLDILHLGELAQSKPARLSGGQKQRVALARALARRPQLLLLDEPLSALDARMRVELQHEISRVHTMFGSTTVLVSHDLHEVFRLAAHIVRMEMGKVTASGSPEEVFSDTSVSGKFQVTGQIAAIEKQDVVNIVTVITGTNTLVRIIAFDDDIAHLAPGDSVLVFSKAFNPIIKKL